MYPHSRQAVVKIATKIADPGYILELTSDELTALTNDCRMEGTKQEVRIALAVQVMQQSSSSCTLRPGSPKLFEKPASDSGTGLNLVLCPSTTPPGEVTELSEGMFLVRFQPLKDGLDLDIAAARATPETAEQSASHPDRTIESVQRQVAASRVSGFLMLLTRLLVAEVQMYATDDVIEELAKARADKPYLSLEELFYFCRKIDSELIDLIDNRPRPHA